MPTACDTVSRILSRPSCPDIRRAARVALVAALGFAAPWPANGSEAEPLPAWARVPLPSDRIADGLHVSGQLVLATARGVYALPAEAPGAARRASHAPGGAAGDPGMRPPELGSTSDRSSTPRRSDGARPDRVWRTVLGRVEAYQLAAWGGSLRIAAESGLWTWDLEGRPRRAPEVGAPVRSVVVGPRGIGWASSASGLFVLEPGGATWRRSDALAEREILALHVSQRGDEREVWAATPGALWRLESGKFRRVLARLTEGWWELRGVARRGAETWLGVPQGIWIVEGDRTSRLPAGPGELSRLAAKEGRAEEIVLVRDRRLACVAADGRIRPEAEGGVVLGLLRAESPVLLALHARGVRGVRCAAAPAIAAPGVLSTLPEPAESGSRPESPRLPRRREVARLHRLVLEYLDLSPGPMRRLEGRAARKGLWPELRIGMGMDARRSRGQDRDQTFSSGEVRNLLDLGRDRQRDSGVEVQLIWKLDDASDPSELLAISKERRERIELREQVLERVDQIFFERARIRARLFRNVGLPESERIELEIRARELTAALDAWTGGRFSAR